MELQYTFTWYAASSGPTIGNHNLLCTTGSDATNEGVATGWG